MTACRGCGRPMPAGARWCALCHRRALAIDPNVLLEELQSSFTRRDWWEAPAHLTAPSPRARWSRVHAGPLSFGWIARVTLTSWVALAAGSVLVFASWHPVFLGVGAIAVAVPAGLALREIWRRARVE